MKKEITFNQFKGLINHLIKEETEKNKTILNDDDNEDKDNNDKLSNQNKPKINDELKKFVVNIAQIKKMLNVSGEKIRKIELDYKNTLDNDSKRQLGEFYYDIDLIITKLDDFKKEYVKSKLDSNSED